MIEEKFAAADDAPDKVFKNFAFLFRAGFSQQRQDFAGFLCRGCSGKADEKDFVEQSGVIGNIPDPASDTVIRDSEFLIDGVTV